MEGGEVEGPEGGEEEDSAHGMVREIKRGGRGEGWAREERGRLECRRDRTANES